MRRTEGTEGSILVWALLFTILASAMIVSHSTYMAANRTAIQVQYEHTMLADNFARSGLTDSLAWFQRQPTQPVTQFAPENDPDGDPPVHDTMDPAIGLVQEFEVRGNLWGRYEARTEELADVSTQRGQDSEGIVWDVGSRGYLYQVADPTVPFDQAPNRVIASTYVRTEIRGISLMPPAQSAVSIDDPARIEVGPNADIVGGERPAIAYPAGKVMPVTLGTGQVRGTPMTSAEVQFDSRPTEVFSMQLAQLRSLSDYVLEESTTSERTARGGGGDGSAGPFGLQPQEPVTRQSLQSWQEWYSARFLWNSLWSRADPVSCESSWSWQRQSYAAGTGQQVVQKEKRELDQQAVFVEGDLTLGPNDAITGKALLVVDGDLVVQEGNVSMLKGMVYVTGDAQIDGEFRLEGMLVVRGKLRLGYGTRPVLISYDRPAFDALKLSIERYRLSRSVRPGWAR